MATRSLNVQITGDARDLNRVLSGTEGKLGKFGKAAGVVGAAAGGALALGLTKAVTAAADFEQQLDKLGSVSRASGKQMAALRKQAMDAGAATKFSAMEAAQAQTELAKGGLELEEILSGGLSGALGLAAAGEMDLAEAASTTANALNLFKLEGSEATHVADAFATAANATTADVADFSMALKAGGSVAKSAGLSFDETTLALEALAAAGIKNSDAGTSLKAALIAILKPTDDQAQKAKALGLNFIDAAGNMKSMADISAMLRDKLGNLTAAQRTNALATIAGTDGVRTLTSLYDAGPKALDKYAAGLRRSGTAAEVAAKNQDNLKGKWENFMGSIETLSIQVGTKLLPFLTDATVAATRFINKTQQGRGPLAALARMMGTVADAVSDLVGWFRRHRTSTTVLMSVVAGLTAGWATYRIAVLAAATATKAMAVAQAALTVIMNANPISLVVAAVVALGAAFVTAYKRSATFRRVVDTAFRTVRAGAEDAATALKAVAIPAFNQLKSVVDKAARGLRAVGGALGAIKGAAGKGADWIGLGDGLGMLGGSAGKSGAGLMGADFDLAPFARIGAGMGLRVSSGLRPGAITSSGNASYHGSGDAIDMAGPPGAMMRFARTMKGMFGSKLRELIYTPMGAGIKDGRPFTYSGQVAADHYDHVHVAYTGPFGDGPGRSLRQRIGDGLGKFVSTAYGPPWGGMQGSGVTATGVDLKSGPKRYGVAVDPSVVPLGTRARIWPNPFGWRGFFEAFDTGGAIKGKRLDFYDWRGRKAQSAWGRRTVTITSTDDDSGSGGGGASPKVSPGSTARQRFAESQSNASGAAGTALRNARRRGGGGYVMGPNGLPVRRGSGSGPQKGGERFNLGPDGGDVVGGEAVSDPAAEALAAAIEAQTRATEEHTAALKTVGDEMKRQTDLAQATIATDSFQKSKWIADVLSGQFGRGIVGRGMTAGTGVEVAF